MAHWHDFNPWAKEIVYLASMEEYALCHADLGGYCDCTAIGGGSHEKMTVEWIINHALNNARIKQGTTNPKVDPYILPQPSGHHSLGMRIGPEGSDYHSPPCNPAIAEYFIKKYGGRK